MQGPRFPAFIAMYEAALLINDLITAALLFGLHGVFRQRALLHLATGYLFTAAMAIPHALTFPGLFSDSGLLGAGPQTTAWLYMFWHTGFPIAVIAYARTKEAPPMSPPVRSGRSIARSLLVVGAAVLACVYASTAGHDLLPPIMTGDTYSERMSWVVGTVWAVNVAALGLLWVRKPHSVLDVWLMVVMCAWLFDIALAALLNRGRYDVGFYAGRIYGLVAATSVLIVLVAENSKVHRELLAAHAEARGAIRGKDAFLAMVGHELRNPVAALSNSVAALARLPMQDRRAAGLLAIAERQLAQLMRLVEDIVDAGRIATGRLQLKIDRVDLGGIARHAFTALRDTGRFADHRASIATDAVLVSADPQRIEQVVTNLLVNAVKYTPPGGVIELAVYRAGEEAVLRLRDEGIGMTPEDLGHACEWFYQANAGVDDARGGLGIGLALVRTLVEMHAGRVDIESAGRGTGTTVTVRLPASAPEAVREPLRVG